MIKPAIPHADPGASLLADWTHRGTIPSETWSIRASWWGRMDSGTTAAWVGSVVGGLTLVVTSWAVALEALSRRTARIRGQAELIGSWFGGATTGGDQLLIANMSSVPIYEVVASMVFVQGAAPRTIEDWVRISKENPESRPLNFGSAFTALGPGRWSVRIEDGWGVMAARPSCEVGFTDAGGRHWIRRGDGRLERLRRNAIDHYGIDRPVDFQPPHRAAE